MNDHTPELSLVIPCYNEQTSLRHTVYGILDPFRRSNINLQLVLVNNGSTDQTEEVIDNLISEGHPITKVAISHNQGYGFGILRGFEQCLSPVVGFLHADGQISPEDVVAIYNQVVNSKRNILSKARRINRQDGWKRKIVSICYNAVMFVVFGHLGGGDVNASPKMLTRENLDSMQLVSTDWFLDPEMMIKAKYLDLDIVETEVEGLPRHAGESNVRISTILEFIKNILRYRLSESFRDWRSEIKAQKLSV